ncbi:MAG: regulator [Gammaproteobacteria bacterium]|nr:MAG: regulator [Gammaproteobacteria bacterium]
MRQGAQPAQPAQKAPGAAPAAAPAPGPNPAGAAALPPTHPPLPAGAGTGTAAVDTPWGRMRFVQFEIGSRNVKSIYAERGVVWIGTSGGVIRYDTASDSHRIFDNKLPGILSNGVFYVGRVGRWIAAGTYGGGLSLYDEQADRWRNVNIPQGLADQFVYGMLTARNGDVWIATWSGVNRVRGGRFFDPQAWDTFTVESTGGGLPNPWVYALAEGPDGSLWFGTEDGLARYRDGRWRHWKHEDGLGAPFEAVKGAIEFTSDPGRASRHHAHQKETQGLEGVNVAYNPNYIISMAVDRRGVVWCGTWGAGLARFDGWRWRNLTTRDGLPSNHIFMLHLDPQGRLWVGTSRGLALYRGEGRGFQILTTAQGLYADNVFSMAEAPDGSVWVGSFGGVTRYYPAP